MHIKQIQHAVKDVVRKNHVLDLKLNAAKVLHDAACYANDGQDADRLRKEIHDMMDELLDNNAVLQTLYRQSLDAS